MPDRIIEEPEVCVCGNVIDFSDEYPGVCAKCGKIS